MFRKVHSQILSLGLAICMVAVVALFPIVSDGGDDEGIVTPCNFGLPEVRDD